MTNNQLTDERVTSVIERLEHYACNLKWTNVRGAQDLLTAADGLRELQERRKADSEPVAEVYQAPNVGICAALGPSIRMLCPLEPGTKLYLHAQPATASEPLAVTDDELNAALQLHRLKVDGHSQLSDAFRAGFRYARRTTPQPVPVVPENCVTAEHRRVIEMLLNVCGAAFELADDSCQQDVDGEDCHVVPDDAFQKLSDALDEIENTLPTEDIDRPDVFLAWSAMPRAALKSLLQAQPAPVVSAELLHTAASAIEDLLTTKDRTGACVWFDLPFRLRSAANAQPAPVVPVGLEHLRSIVADPRLLPRRKEWIGGQQYSYVLLEEVEAIVDEACRAAMLSGGKS
ncbi:hypothetical protein RUW59_03785 [Klebsiella pneumoniae]|uniref:hypothetical protein n=1 Tax=Klebsiella pneumoniae TaxID=573 RepID=UPI0028F94B97|nr:hypothetical protein [Klebsiella pneumoniae]MDT9784609.1 hypothetical protein [Klebsiella pneumoniae]MDT9878320.1 hypothetical protein [Klebsiella pneumoniae]